MSARPPAVRVLSVGHRFLDTRITSTTYGSPLTMLAFDAVLWWPGRVFGSYEHDFANGSGQPRLSQSDSRQSEHDISRRSRELEQFLEMGRTLVTFVPAPLRWHFYTGRTKQEGSGRSARDVAVIAERNIESLLPLDVGLVEAQGTEIELRGGGPTAEFWRSESELFFHSAYMTKPPGHAVLFMAGTDHAVGSISKVGPGTLVMLPETYLTDAEEDYEEEEFEGGEVEAPQDPDELEKGFVDALLLMLEELRSEAAGELPPWADELFLPNEKALVQGIREAEERLAAAQRGTQETRAAHEHLKRRKALVVETGTPLEEVVEEALRALGFEVEAGAPSRTDRIARADGREAVVEVKGLDKSAAERHAAQLQKWVSEHHADTEVEPKGLLVANAWRRKPLHEREEAFPDQMVGYAERQALCLVTGAQLLCAWSDVERDPKKAPGLLDSLFACSGRWDRYQDWREVIELVQARETG